MQIRLFVPGPGVLSITVDTDPAVLLSLQDLVSHEAVLETQGNLLVEIEADEPPVNTPSVNQGYITVPGFNG